MVEEEQRRLLRETIARLVAPDARIIAIAARDQGEQGYSGARLQYFDVIYAHGESVATIALVTKPATLVERRTLAWLGALGLPVPFSYTSDLVTDTPVLVCLHHAGRQPQQHERARLAARALAAIHHAALGRADELPWLPLADPAFFAERIVDTCWRRHWRHALTGAAYVDWYGRQRPAKAAGDPFWAQFAGYDRALEAAAVRFLADMAALWRAGDALTLIHADFHGSQLLAQDGRAAIIDWEQALYGPLYIDLPNYFTREEALLYRDALADLGQTIPLDRFLAGYDAAAPYVGLKYFGFGVLHWRPGDPPRRREQAMKWIDLVLNGASGGNPATTPSAE